MTVYGADVSRYQPGLSVAALRAAGAQFLIARASRGHDTHDPEYARFKAEAKTAGLPFAAYHFLTDADPEAQADNIAGVVGRHTPIMLDLEPHETSRPTLPRALAVATALTARGRRPRMLYYPRWYWDQTGRPDLTTSGLALVQSNYPHGYTRGGIRGLYPGDTHNAWADQGGVTPLLWQYTSSTVIPGYTANTVDADAFRGTLADLRAENLFRWWGSDTVDPVATTANGWPVLFDNRTTGDLPRLRKWIVPDAGRHLYLRDGSVGFNLIHLALWFHERIERLDLGVWDDWGWAVRPIRGQTSGYSNHAGGAAEDLNATRHPLGVPVAATFTDKQAAAIHRRLPLYEGCVEWGGDWSRPDGMHFEAARDLAAHERVARLLVETPRGRRVIAANPGALDVINA